MQSRKKVHLSFLPFFFLIVSQNMVKRKGKSWDGNFHKPAHRTFPYEMRRARLFHALKISLLFPPREIRLPRSIEFHFVRNGRNSGYSNERIHRATWFDSFFAKEKKKINFHRNLRRISSSLKSSSLFFFVKQFFNIY